MVIWFRLALLDLFNMRCAILRAKIWKPLSIEYRPVDSCVSSVRSFQYTPKVS